MRAFFLLQESHRNAFKFYPIIARLEPMIPQIIISCQILQPYVMILWLIHIY